MKLRQAALCCAVVLLLFGASAAAQEFNHKHYDKNEHDAKLGPEGQLAPRLMNVGEHKFPVTTKSERAQQFIHQGINLSYGFNHAEAGRAFAEAARLDPGCAMAYWGQALVLGPNINAPMNPDDEPKAYELVQKAMALRERVSARERAYIEALAKRYTGNAADRSDADRVYANAMREVAWRFPDDLDAATLFAEAMMDLRPWNYWTRDNRPYPGTEEIIATLQKVMARSPNHPGALHLWIHMMEPTANPERGEEAADRLLLLAPAAGHLVHMPSHIYVRVGRYADAARSNELAIAADEDYITQCRAQGFYPVSYYPHNIHFLWFAETLRGRGEAAVAAARKVAAKMSPETLRESPFLQFFAVVPYQALVRFGRWEEILREPRPGFDGPLVVGMWHFARGMAWNAKGHTAEAAAELAEVRKRAEDPEVQKLMLWSPNSVGGVLAIGVEILAGEIAARNGELVRAVAHLDRAVRLEDALAYIEPPDWGLPARHVLGAVLLKAGRAAEAEVVYWDDLRRQPENGWALYGLMQALRAQGKDDEAVAIEARFRRAWSDADVQLAASRF
ncbi:MAG: hypothetical protein K6U02_07345 [Firmicutes bacterium]|nr:hypothetical protein [Bacillota bacterium]